MAFVELLNYVVQAQLQGPPIFQSVEPMQCASNCSYFFDGQPGCPGSSFTAIGAAFATQGYFAQADLLWQLTNTNLGLWAPLLYVMAAIGGLIGVAMGMPPKMYLWFFMGPAIYSFLLGTTLPTYGTSWCVANIAQDQQEVWKFAEVGLRNSNIVALSRSGDYGSNAIQIYQYQEPSNPVEVSYLFLWFDSLVSSTVQWMTVWTGVYQQVGGDGDDSGIIKAPAGAESITADQYYLMSNLKWPMLDRITSARVHNGSIRDAFVTFLSSECGDALARGVEPGNLIAASNSKTGQLPYSVFRGVVDPRTLAGPPVNSGGSCSSRQNDRDYSNITKLLAGQLVPIPLSVRSSWWNPNRATSSSASSPTADLKGTLPGFYQNYSFSYFEFNQTNPFTFLPGFGLPFIPIPNGSTVSQNGGEHIDKYLEEEDNLSCADLLFYVMNGLRWEAGQIYYQLVSTAPRNMNSDQVIFNLFYGWDLRDQCGEKLSTEGMQHFLKDLILVHLVRNEMGDAPKVVDSRFSGQSAVAANPGNKMIASSGAKAKFGEVYTWALMMPYVQGVLLYLLAMAYPFVCVMIVVPGWHKTLFTWMSFWTWVKLWDLGFAVVLVLERSIWAVMGNNSTAQALSGRISEMQSYGKVFVDSCSRTAQGDCPTIPKVYDLATVSGAAGLQEAWKNLVSILDRSMLVGSSIDFDVQNGYYIYIMSALYFAVPAVTGQLVLGAKAGASGMVSNLTQGAQNDGGKAAQSKFTGDRRNIAAANAATVNQEGMASDYRSKGLAQQAIDAANNQLGAGLASSAAGQLATGLNNTQGMHKLAEGVRSNNLQTGGTLFKGSTTIAGIGGGAAKKLSDAMGLSDADAAKEYKENSPSSMAPPGADSGTGASPLATGAGASALATGSSATGGAGGTAVKLGAGAYSAAQAAKNSAIDMATAAQGNAIMRGYAGKYAGLQAGAAGAGLNQFLAGAQQQGYGLQANRMDRAAGFSAEQAAFEKRRDFANQVSGDLAAIGVDSSVVGPGNKPTDMMGMAMSGMLGSAAKTASNYANPNGGAYFSQAAGAYNSLNSQYGQAALSGIYNNYKGTASSEMGSAWGQYQGMPIAGSGGIDKWDITPVNPDKPVSGDGGVFGDRGK